MDIANALLTGLNTLKSISSGTITSGSLSADVSVSYGFGYDRGMLDAGYNPQKTLSVLVATSDLTDWVIIPRKTKVTLSSNTISGVFQVENVSSQNPAVTYLILANII